MHSLFEPLEMEARAGTQLAPVVLPSRSTRPTTTCVPDGRRARAPGAFVLVPFGPQTPHRHRLGRSPSASGGKPVDRQEAQGHHRRLVDVPPLPAISLRFAEWVARYTLAPLGMVVRMMMGARAVFEPAKPRFGVRCVEGAPEPPRMTPARKRALEIAGDGLVRAKAALAAEAGCSTGVIDGLVAAGSLVEVAIPERRLPAPNPAHATTEFATAQARAVARAARRASMRGTSPSRCSTASPAPARRRSTSRRSRARWRRAGRR